MSRNPQRRSIRLAPRLENLPVLERFVAACDFLDGTTRARATIVVTEIFDNIIAHSRPCFSCRVFVSLAALGDPIITIRYNTMNFGEMIRGSRSARPHYDPGSERYRGIGLVMCRNLSHSIAYRRGLLRSSILIIL